MSDNGSTAMQLKEARIAWGKLDGALDTLRGSMTRAPSLARDYSVAIIETEKAQAHFKIFVVDRLEEKARSQPGPEYRRPKSSPILD